MAQGLNISQQKQEALLDVVVGYAVKAVIIGGTIHVAKKWIDNANENIVDQKASTDPNVNAAIQFRHGINPSGFEWLMIVDGTNFEAVLNAADMVQDFVEVQKAYKLKYRTSLIDDLSSDLNANQYAKAIALSRQSAGITSNNSTFPNQLHLYKKGDGILLINGAKLSNKITNKEGFIIDSSVTSTAKVVSLHYLTLSYPDGTTKKEAWYKVTASNFWNPFSDITGYVKEKSIRGKNALLG